MSSLLQILFQILFFGTYLFIASQPYSIVWILLCVTIAQIMVLFSCNIIINRKMKMVGVPRLFSVHFYDMIRLIAVFISLLHWILLSHSSSSKQFSIVGKAATSVSRILFTLYIYLSGNGC